MNSSRCIRFLAVALVLAGASRLPAAEIRMPRHPDTFEGKIAFSYLGDIWLVNDDGTNPRRMTTHAARDSHPRFSPDGKWIAFSSNRYGNDDVFVMPAAGGTAKRLTYNSAGDAVAGWSRDSKRVMFSSSRGRVYGGIPSLYEVPVDGGAETPLPTDWGTFASYSPDGKQLVFNRHPAPWARKHYRGSYCADLWMADLDTKTFRKLLDADLPDEEKPNNMWPMFGRDGVYFVSDRGVRAKAGTPEVFKSVNNIWKLSNGSPPVQVTQHTSGSLFWPSMSADGRTIVYEESFGLWKLDLTNGGKPVEVKIDIVADERENNLETRTITNEADAYNLSPSGKRAVVSVEGELFSIATDRGEAHRLTNTSGAREVQPQWSPDGKWIAFIGDSSGREEIWMCDERGGQSKMVYNSDSVKSAPVWSPDSKALLYSASDKKLHKYTLESGQTDDVASGEVVGFGGTAISNAQWSPDGKWISFSRSDKTLLPHVFIVPASGGEARRVTGPDIYSDTNAHWTPDGKRLVYSSGVDVGNIGAPGRSTAQLYAVSLATEEKDPSDRGVDSEAAAAESDRQTPRGPRGGGGGDATPAPKPDVKIDFDRIERRARQLTRSGDAIQGVTVAPDSKSLVFVTSGVEGGRTVQSIWQFTFEGDRTTRLTQTASQADDEGGPPARGGGGGQGYSSLQFAKDGRTLFYRSGRNIYALSIGGGAPTPSSTTAAPAGGGRRGGGGAAPAAASADTPSGTARQVAFTAKVEIDHRARRKQVFNEAWRVMKTRFYDPAMHGVDWERMKSMYEPLLEHIGEQDDLYDVVNMMIGELNASHTGHSGGGRGRARGDDVSDQTRNPGFDLEPNGGFYRVSHIYRNGPADKDFVKIKFGDYILAIDGQDLKAGDNYWKYFTVSPGTRFEFTVNSKPEKEGAWATKVTPVSGAQFGNLQYQRWVDERRAMVDKMSNGDIGYLHIRQMNEPSLRQFERDLGMLRAKKALVVDQRFNPGGNIDQELLEILGQRQYQYTKQRDSIVVQRPLSGFFGPKVVMENERSTSDAEVFPDGFRTLKLGKVVGVTTYGAVIGTGSYSLMDGSTIRTPGSGLWNVNGTNLENYGVPPDVYVDNTPGDFLQNRDAQLEKAVDVLKDELKKTKNDR
jgi:tricorn protease